MAAAGTQPVRNPFVTLRRFLLFLVTIEETPFLWGRVFSIQAYIDYLFLLRYNRNPGKTWLRVSHIMHPMSRRNFPHGGVFQGMGAAAVWLYCSLYRHHTWLDTVCALRYFSLV